MVVKFSVPEMHCAGCIAAVTRAIQASDKAATVAASLETHIVEVTSHLPPDQLASLIEDAGFTAKEVA